MIDAVSTDRPATRRATRFGFFVAGFAMASWAPQVPYAKARLEVGNGAFGLYLLCLGIGSIVAMPLTGALVARVGSRPAIIAGGTGLCIALPLMALAGTGATLAACLVLFGASLGMIDVAINVHAIEVEQAAGEPLMSGFHGMFSLGGLSGALGATAMLAGGLSPVVSAAAGSSFAMLLLILSAPHLLRTEAKPTGPMFAVPRGIVVLVGALAFAAFLTEGALLDWGALLLTGSLGFAASHAGIGYIVFSVAMTVGRLTGDVVVRSLGIHRVLLGGGLMVSAGFAWLLMVPMPWIAMGGFLLIGIGAANLVPVLFSSAGRQRAMPAELAVASITTLGYAGILVGPALIGFVAEGTSLRAAFSILAILMLGFPLLRMRIPAGAEPTA